MNELARAYDAGLTDGKLLLQFCGKCERHIMYPRYRCPFCYSAELGWREAAGTGTLYSYTVQYLGAPATFADQLPYALGVVRLTEGTQVLGRLVPDAHGAWDGYRCDVPVAFFPPGPPSGSERPCAWFRLA